MAPPGRVGPFPPMADHVRADSLAATLAERPNEGPVWIFAYGSLIWRPCFSPRRVQPGQLRGYQRRFSMWTVSARGSPELPGLGLALEKSPGGRSEPVASDGQADASVCEGLLLEVARATLLDDLKKLWVREMLTGIYRPAWVEAEFGNGEKPVACSALTFVVDPRHPQYAGQLNLGEQARLIAQAAGELGTCYEYLASTVSALGTYGIVDASLQALLRAVDEVREH